MKYFLFTIVSFLTTWIFSQSQMVYLHPNRGQWDNHILYNVEIHNGNLFLDQNGYTINIRGFNHHDELDSVDAVQRKNYAFKIKYLNVKNEASFEEKEVSPFYRNYFLGNDKTKWVSKVYSYQSVTRKNLYHGIDVETKGTEDGSLEIVYHVAPYAFIQPLKIKYEGFDNISIERDGSLKMSYPLGEVTESKPIAWNIDSEGNKKVVTVNYKLKDNIVTFEFPEGYDQSLPLVIDPTLAFSTFTGATSDNWGFTAAPDGQGNAFGGGIAFGPNYPFSAGAYDNSFGGGTVDVAISKFSSNGSQLLYSTFIGGSSSETPNSIKCDANGDLYIMGLTGSPNFPTSTSAYQSTYGGGTYFSENGIGFTNGSDIFVFKLNSTGTNMLASTFIGGTGNDGVNRNVAGNGNVLVYNYGDQFRGDITLDATGNVFVASSTFSQDFPTVNSSTVNGGVLGTQDGVAFKLNSSLTNLAWSTYIGGNVNDAAYSIQVSNNGNIYVAGGTNSTNLTFPLGEITSLVGGTDGFIAKFNSSYNLIGGTFVGTPGYDQVYFVQLDNAQNVYVLGQTLGNMTITAGKYGNANSSQFIRKYNNNLTSELWTTLIGSGNKKIDISPTAFLVSNCYDIYMAGWGGEVNRNHSQATQSSTVGLPITSDAVQATTNGNNFYIAMLGKDALTLKYGTFIGGLTSSANHVDGGTSRFDKNGKMYHAVCGACGGNDNGFTTTPGVYSPTNNSNNCNMAVFKFEMSFIETNVANINPVVCFPNQITFNNVTTTGNVFYWDFGDETTSNQLSPTHIYAQPGTYDVNFVVADTANCFVSDTSNFTVEVKDFNGQLSVPNDSICSNMNVQLTASGGATYKWSPSQFFNNDTIPNPIVHPNATTTYSVIIHDEDCGSDTLSTTIHVFNDSLTVSNDTTICLGDSVQLLANGLTSYNWSPNQFLNDSSIANPISKPTNSITYTVSGTSIHGCNLSDQTKITVNTTVPHPAIPDTVGLCYGSPATITVSGADTYAWSPNLNISTTSGNTVVISPSSDGYYYCDFSTYCQTVRDSVFAKIIHPQIKAWNDTTVCFGIPVTLTASGALNYSWFPTVTPLNTEKSKVKAQPDQSTTYYVTGYDQYGCAANDSVVVTLFPRPFVDANPDIYAQLDEEIHLGIDSPEGGGSYVWTPSDYLSCDSCLNPIATPNKDIVYTVIYTDKNGCLASDNVHIYYDPLLWVPNTFTPDGSGHNDVFRYYGVNISNVTMDIYDRWGELIYTIKGPDDFWDGTYKGLKCPIGTYVWKMEYTDSAKDIVRSKAGHVNLIR